MSVSGLHVGIVAGILWVALGAMGLSQRRAVLIVIPCLFFYALVTGFSAASLRASIMLSVLAAGLLVDRPGVPLNSIGAAGFVLLLADSSQLFNAGFQLSFGAVLAICLFAGPLQRSMNRLVAPDPFLPARLISPSRKAAHALAAAAIVLVAVSFAAWLASLPLILAYFHLISLSSIPANLLAVPISTAILGLAAVSLLAGLFSPWLAGVFNHANFLVAKALLAIVNTLAALPGSAVYLGPPPPPGELARLVVLDAGAGGAIVGLARDGAWLVDGGSESFARSVTVPFLRQSGVNTLDLAVLTHGDGRHIGGFERLAEAFNPRLVLDSGLPDRSPTRHRILAAYAFRPAAAGAVFPVGTLVRLRVLYPPSDARNVLADDKAIVLRVEIGAFSALLVSDAGLATEQWLLAHAAADLPCDLLVMGRHVSGLSGDPGFLRAAQPQALVATCADFPQNEFLPESWTRSVRALGIALFRQDETGAVTVTVREDSFTLTPFLPSGGPPRTFPNDPADPRR